MRVSQYTFVAFQLLRAIDSGRYASITPAEIKDAAERGAAFELLEQRLGKGVDGFDLSILEPEARATIAEEWRDMALALPDHKLAVEDQGLCLLLAYLLEGLQRRKWRDVLN